MTSSATHLPICVFCNCPSSCSLGQGDLVLISFPTEQSHAVIHSTSRSLEEIPLEKRDHFILETGKLAVPVDSDLFSVGFQSSADVTPNGNFWAHERCLKWALPNTDTSGNPELVRTAALNAANQKCTICDRYGASLSCRNETCTWKFHLPCAQSSGCFFSHSQSAFLCPQHLDSVVSIFDVESSSCEACSEPGDVRGQLFCTNCDKHYHAECLMLEANRVVRTGWRCPDCKICQTCRQAGDDDEMIMCNVCDKGYHTFCLRNQSIPKDGWSCSSCLSLTNKTSSTKTLCNLCQNEILYKQSIRQCHSCQARIHSTCHSLNDDYYDDDTAYICRTCSLSSSTATLPMDEGDDDEDHKEIYRSSSSSILKVHRSTSKSQKFNNSPGTSPAGGISTRKRRSIDYSQQSSLEYTPGGGDSSEMTTPMTGGQLNDPPLLFESLSSIKDETSEHSMDLPMSVTIKQEDDDQPVFQQPIKSLRTQTSQKSGKGKPAFENRTCGGEISKKRARRALNNGHRRASSPQSNASATTQATTGNQQRASAAAGGACRGRPPKVRKDLSAQSSTAEEPATMPMTVLNTSSGSTGSTYTVGAVKRDDDEHHAVTVLCASDELYTLGQDMCVSCGSFGLDEEGRLISCTQCGQSYHSYCAGSIKLSKVILKQGWRCLDCTVCEGCGKPTDESRLLLCDDCDISYHTYCLQPPLDQVPKGNWKCQWCVRCLKCATTNPGPSGSTCLWQNNYTECAPCHSLVTCPVCSKPYRIDELIVQCTVCDRWLHGSCEQILSEDSTLSTTGDFVCSLCRPAALGTSTSDTLPSSSSPKSSSPSDQAPLLVVTTNLSASNQLTIAQPQLPTPKATKLDEGVYLTDTGLAQLKSIRVKPLPKKAAAAAAIATSHNAKSKRGALANFISGGVKRNNSSSIQDDDMVGNSATGGGSGTSDDEGTKKVTATVPTAKAAKGYTGIGGFHVKIRGQRRRQDQSSSLSELPQDDNLHDDTSTMKRKRDRRPLKKKSVLEEHMPPEMQEAFFGSDLAEKSRLMAQHHLPVVPLQLNDQSTAMNTPHTHDYTIKLDHDTINRFVIKRAAKLAMVVKEEQRQPPAAPAPALPSSLPAPAITAPDDENDMPEILDNEEFCNFVEYMMNTSKTTQDPMLPLCGPTDIEDFLEFIEHPETHNDLQAVDLLNNANPAAQNASLTVTNTSTQLIQSHQTTIITSTSVAHHAANSQVPMATPTSNLVVMATNVPDNSKQIINNLAREMMESTGLHTTNTASILPQTNIANAGLIPKQEFHDHPLQPNPMMLGQPQPPQQQIWNQQQTMIRMPIMQPAGMPTPANTTPNPDRSSAAAAEHTNLMERTREDELLGENATMSNVLYCNVNHPDLKQQFPDFNERFKQMKKIWRKVPTDAKQTYTQKARLNRTKRRALKSTSSQSSTTSKGTKRKNSAKQQSSEPEDNNNDGGAGSESRSSTPSSSATNETNTVVIHPNEHPDHATTHLYQQPRQMYSPSSGNLMVTTPTAASPFHHQPYSSQQPPQQQMQRPPQQPGYGTVVSAPTGYPPAQRFSFPPQQQGPPPQQQSQSSPYFEYTPSTPRPILHQSSSAESTPILHSGGNVNSNPIRKSTSSSDANTPYHHVSPMDETSPYHQQQSPYANQNQMKPQQQQLMARGMTPRPQQIMPRFPQQDGPNFVRTPSSGGVPGQPTRFVFASPPNQQQQQQQPTHYVQYTQQGQAQHTIVIQQGANEAFQRMPESPAHQHMQQQQQHHQVSPQFSPHHRPMTPNSQQHPMIMQQQQHHMSPYSSQQPQSQPTMHHSHPQHSPTIVLQPTSQFSPSSVHHHQLALSTSGHQSPPNDPNKRALQMAKPPQQTLTKQESMSFDEPQVKVEPNDDSLNDSSNTGKSRADPFQSVPPHVLEQIDEVINEVVSGAGIIPQEIPTTPQPPTIPVQIVPLTQPKIQPQHMITGHHPYVQQPSHEWSNYQQQPTLNIAAMRGPPTYAHYHPQQQQQQQHHHDLLPATTNVINTAGVPQHEQQQIVAERISSILASSPHEQQQTTVTQAPIQIKRAWPMNQHPQAESHFLAATTTESSISLEDLLERDYKDKQQQQQQQQQQSTTTTEWPVERAAKPSGASTAQQAPLSLAHAVHLLQQAITHPLYQQSPPPELSGLVSVGRDNDLNNANASINEEQFERYARWLKQRREINSLRIKADETNLADIKKKRNILLRKQKQSLCTPEEEQEMPRLSQQQTEYSRTLTAMRKERKQFDELEQAFLVYKQSRLNTLYPPKSSPAAAEQQSDNVVRLMSMNSVPQTSIQPQRFLSDPLSNIMTFTSSSATDEQEDFPNDDQASPSPSASTEAQAKQPTSMNVTLASIPSSSSPSSSFMTPTQASMVEPSLELHQLTSSPNPENDSIPFEPCHTSPLPPAEEPVLAAAPLLESNTAEELEP